jgi:hypothetical protein
MDLKQPNSMATSLPRNLQSSLLETPQPYHVKDHLVRVQKKNETEERAKLR